MHALKPITVGTQRLFTRPAMLNAFRLNVTHNGHDFGLALRGVTAHKPQGQPLAVSLADDIAAGDQHVAFEANTALVRIGKDLARHAELIAMTATPQDPSVLWKGPQQWRSIVPIALGRGSNWTVHYGSSKTANIITRAQNSLGASLEIGVQQDRLINTSFAQHNPADTALAFLYREPQSLGETHLIATAIMTIDSSTDIFLRRIFTEFTGCSFPDDLPSAHDAGAWATFLGEQAALVRDDTIAVGIKSFANIGKIGVINDQIILTLGGTYNHSSQTLTDHHGQEHRGAHVTGMPLDFGAAAFFAAATEAVQW